MGPLEPLEPLSFVALWKIDLYIDLCIDITSGTSWTSRIYKFSIFVKTFLLAGTFEPFEPIEPLSFEVFWKIDLYINLYVDNTSGTFGTSRTSKFSIFEK